MFAWVQNKYIPYLFIVLSLFFQFALLSKYITPDITSSLHPYGDSHEYVQLTEDWRNTGNFTETFKSGWRLPGYPAFMFIGYSIADALGVAPLTLVKILQLLLGALIPFFSYRAIINFSGSATAAFIGGLVITIYYPFYYFSPLIGAESVSLFLLSILFYQMSFAGKRKITRSELFFLALNIAILTYLKPNHILFLLPAAILLIKHKDFTSAKIFESIKRPLILSILVIVLMLPWTIFVSSQNRMFIPLATTSGEGRIIGVGIQINDYADSTSLPYKFEKKHNLVADTVFMTDKSGLTTAEINAAYQKEAKAIWMSRPWKTAQYGFVKIAHSLGLGFRDLKDYFSLAVILPVILILLFSSSFRKRYRNISILVGILIVLCWIQSFVYFGDMRMRILMADMAIIFTAVIFIYDIIRKKITRLV